MTLSTLGSIFFRLQSFHLIGTYGLGSHWHGSKRYASPDGDVCIHSFLNRTERRPLDLLRLVGIPSEFLWPATQLSPLLRDYSPRPCSSPSLLDHMNDSAQSPTASPDLVEL